MKNHGIYHWLIPMGLLIFIFNTDTKAQSEDLRFIAPILLKDKPNGSIFLNTRDKKITEISGLDSILNENSQNIIVQNKSIYINVNGTGRLYRVDSIGNTIRIDNTYYQGSSFGAKFLSNNDTLILAGGYGFWNCNGAIKYYKSTFNEWDIFKIKNPIEFSTGINAYTYWNQKKHKLYLIFSNANPEFRYNNNLDKRVKIQCFDFTTKSWWENEKFLNREIAVYLSDLSFITETDRGLVFNTKNNRESILIDFEKEKLFNISETLSDQIVQQFNKSRKSVIYYTNDTVKILDLSKKLTYAIPFNSSFLKENETSLYQNSIQLSEYLEIKTGIIFTLTLLLLYTLFKKRSSLLPESTAKTSVNRQPSQSSDNFNKFFIGLEDDEKIILELLATNEGFKKNTAISELNKKLGIEKRPIKIQNNLRANAIGILNKKFSLITSANEELIERVRSEFDKRFFEYRLNNRFAHIIMKYFGV